LFGHLIAKVPRTSQFFTARIFGWIKMVPLPQ